VLCYGAKLLTFVADKYSDVLNKNQLDTFDKVWNYQVNWFEAPNERRGGWSGVGRLQLDVSGGKPLCLFVKKQQNHGRLTLLHPIRGEPTFRREYKRLQYLADHEVGAPKVIFYGEKIIENKLCAILVTEELDGYQSLDSLTASWFAEDKLTRTHRQQLLKAIAASLRNFHQLGLVHRALYPKHIFVKNADMSTQVALIDLEKARFSPFFWYRAYFDLAALNRHAEHWTSVDRLYFLMQYCRLQRLGRFSKWFCRQLIKRSQRK
jgi:tRNA A-37 threonylcarbamoyl transferase component Bud32